MNVKHLSSSELKGAILGTVLGDSCLRTNGKNASLHMTHCEKQLEYLIFKHDIVQQVVTYPIDIKPSLAYLKKTGKTYKQFIFSTRTSPYFTKIREMTYDSNGIKFVKRDTLNYLTPLGLALWYMDDGYLSLQMKRSRKNPYGGDRYIYDIPHICSRKLKLATHCFPEEQQVIIKNYFRDVWNIDVMIYRPEPIKRPDQRAIYMNATNALKFIEIVKPFILLPLFEKKIDMKYNGSHSTKNEDIVCSTSKDIAIEKMNTVI